MTVPRRIRVRVPASSANLGPGFDSLGLALGLYDEVVGTLAPSDRVEAEGGGVPTDGRNLVLRAARLALPGACFHLRLRLSIPVGRGLGSSAAAVVGGLVAARALAGGAVDPDELLPLAAAIEGHPDNVAPALFGGLCAVCPVGASAGGPDAPGRPQEPRIIAVRLDPPRLHVIACIPDRPLPTAQARQVLPRQVSFGDAVANVQRVALLVAAIATGRWEALDEATRDRLHEPYRAPLVPGLEAALAAARNAGALAAFLSGSGPTVLALTDERAAAGRIASVLQSAFAQHGVTASTRHLTPVAEGATAQALDG